MVLAMKSAVSGLQTFGNQPLLHTDTTEKD
jgi:hypothetical protein